MHAVIKMVPITLVIVLLVFLVWKLEDTWSRKRLVENRLKSLASCNFFDMNNSPVLLDDITDKEILLILFDPDCEHCVSEIRQIRNHLEKLSNAEIVMITTAQNKVTRSFIKQERLDSVPGVRVLRCEPAVFKEMFGMVPFPAVFIYGRNNKLIKTFKGEVDIEIISKSLKSD